MPTVVIEGKRVKVDDAFLSLSPEQQASTVEEIAGQLGITGGGAAPSNNGKSPVSEAPKVDDTGGFGKSVDSFGRGFAGTDTYG